MAEPNYDINYDDSRFKKVESEKTAALSDLENTYAGMINNSDKYYQDQINASKDWADKQTQLQNEKTDFAIQQIEQQKEQAHKDYTKEQSGAYVDWQKQSNEYGANAEQRANIGMAGTGYSESAQVAYYNNYQNRVMTARDSYNQAVLNYNNSIQEARLQNNSILAEIAYEALQKQLELSLAGFQYKNQLLLDKADKKTALEQNYYQRYQDVVNQINTENALAEKIRQYNESLAEEKRQFDVLHPATTGGSSGGGSGGSGGGSSSIKKKNPDKNTTGSGNMNKSIAANKNAHAVATEGKGVKTTVDEDSVNDLNRGPINAEQLDTLVRDGYVEEYVEDGQYKFKNSGKAIANSLKYKSFNVAHKLK